ncbi:nucleotidyltransferase family protein [Demequina gelatinilytica]|uniref:nucleotidyltransferase family protein n=1 Tax=Demequina gelatinilytica TaxID=1638980 RepID=UPI0014706417|nr:nucleotidyltransferase family protein [Demequina gelatinilytica]
MEPSALAAADAVELAHALVDSVGRARGIRVLFLKGPGSAHHGLRPARVSADADAMVAPQDLAAMLDGLAAAGWHEREHSDLAHLFATHSVTLIHDSWPCDIDVHVRFPGFLREPADVFEALWERRVPLTLAGVEVCIPDRIGAILIAALHSLRTPAQTTRHAIEVRMLLDTVLPSLSETERADLASLASLTGCQDTARPVLERFVALPPPTPARVDPDLDAWRVRTGAQGSSTVQHWQIIAGSPLRRRPRLIWNAFWRSEQDLRRDHPEIRPGRAALVRARFERWGRGLRAAPGVVSSLARARRGETDRTLTRPDKDGAP